MISKYILIIISILAFPLLSQADQAQDTSTKSGNGVGMDEIVLAGGCFWGMEDLFRTFEGVLDTKVGYAGGDESKATYDFVKTGKTGHAEALWVRYDPSKTSLEAILKYFFKIHDPTTLNRQGNDIGTQYRSAIFYTNDQQKEIAGSVIDKIDKAKVWKSKIITVLEPLKSFTPAEEYHQNYLQKNPRGYTCHFERDIEL
jgi:methionine-S-sulfoxide reductase